MLWSILTHVQGFLPSANLSSPARLAPALIDVAYSQLNTIHVELSNASQTSQVTDKFHVHLLPYSIPGKMRVEVITPYPRAIVVRCDNIARRDFILQNLRVQMQRLSWNVIVTPTQVVPRARRAGWCIDLGAKAVQRLPPLLVLFFQTVGVISSDFVQGSFGNRIALPSFSQGLNPWLLCKVRYESGILEAKEIDLYEKHSCPLCRSTVPGGVRSDDPGIASESNMLENMFDDDDDAIVGNLGHRRPIQHPSSNITETMHYEMTAIQRPPIPGYTPYQSVPLEAEARPKRFVEADLDLLRFKYPADGGLQFPANVTAQKSISDDQRLLHLSWRLPPCPRHCITIVHVTIAGFIAGFIRENGADVLRNAPAAAFVAFFGSFLDRYFRGCTLTDKVAALHRVCFPTRYRESTEAITGQRGFRVRTN